MDGGTLPGNHFVSRSSAFELTGQDDSVHRLRVTADRLTGELGYEEIRGNRSLRRTCYVELNRDARQWH